jgi:hypothetical protein
MTPEQLFSLVNPLALCGWLVLLLAPRWTRGPALVSGVVIPAVLGVVYVALIAARFGSSEGGFGSLAEVQALFADPWLLLAGWIHYLAFDLFIGAWETRDAMRHGVSRWLLAPCLILTFLFGPAGLLLYLALRRTRQAPVALGAA